jgi:hypothetical protein
VTLDVVNTNSHTEYASVRGITTCRTRGTLSTRVLMNAETESSETKRPELKSRLRLSDLMRMEMHAH